LPATLRDAVQAAVNSDDFSVIMRCGHNPQTDVTCLQVVRVDTNEEVHLSDSSFLLRISLGEHRSVLRCFIRHLTSGCEAYVQGGSGLYAFVKGGIWRGHVTHVHGCERRYLKNLDEIGDFIASYLETMGVKSGICWRMRRWLKHLTR